MDIRSPVVIGLAGTIVKVYVLTAPLTSDPFTILADIKFLATVAAT